MESGRIEPLRAPPTHREAQPCLQPPQWTKHIQCTLISPLMGIPTRPIFGDLGGSEALEALEARLRPWYSLDHLEGRPSNRLKKRRFFEVGIEGVALNPNRQ